MKLDSFTLEMSKNHLIRNSLRNGRLRVKPKFYTSLVLLELLWELKREMLFRSDRSRDPPSHVSSADFSEMK